MARLFPSPRKGELEYRDLAVEEGNAVILPSFCGTWQLYAPSVEVVAHDGIEEGKGPELGSFQFRPPDPELFRLFAAKTWQGVPGMELFQSRD